MRSRTSSVTEVFSTSRQDFREAVSKEGMKIVDCWKRCCSRWMMLDIQAFLVLS
jgi:hypothetical protein